MSDIRIEMISHPANADIECRSGMRLGLKDIDVECGEVGEQYPWQIRFDYIVWEKTKNTQPCPHCVDRHIHRHTRHDGYTYDRVVWICQRVVSAQNEGGYNSTFVCLDCILEQSKFIYHGVKPRGF